MKKQIRHRPYRKLLLLSRFSLFLALFVFVSSTILAVTQLRVPKSSSQKVTTLPKLKSADSYTPAAGTCESNSNEQILVATINKDFTTPRCLKIGSGQRLQIENKSGKTIHFKLGEYESNIVSNSSYSIAKNVGDFLEKGVHIVEIQPGNGFEIWLQ